MGNKKDGFHQKSADALKTVSTPVTDSDLKLMQDQESKKYGNNTKERLFEKLIHTATTINPVLNVLSDLVHSDKATESKQPSLNEEGKILQNAYQAFANNGLTPDEITKLKSIDEVLDHASLQLTKNGGAVITDDNGNTTKVKGR